MPERRTGPTQYTEANALLAVTLNDLKQAREIVAEMLPGERARLRDACYELAKLLRECEHKWERSANRDSAWVGYGLPYEYCGSCGAERASERT